MTNTYKTSYFWLVLWHYLNQPLFNKNKRLILNPFKFDQAEKVQFLEHCWKLNYSTKKHN